MEASSASGLLAVQVAGEVPFTVPAIGQNPPLRLFALTGLRLDLDAAHAAFAASASAALPGAMSSGAVVAGLGLAFVRPVVESFAASRARAPTITLALSGRDLDKATASAEARFTFTSPAGESVSLMGAIGQVMAPGRAAAGAPRVRFMGEDLPLPRYFDARPGEVALAVTLGATASLTLRSSLVCVLLDESFDVTATADVTSGGKASVRVEFGVVDPMRLALPVAPPAMLGTDEVAAIARLYGLVDANGNHPLQAVADQLAALFAPTEERSAGVLEFSEVGIGFDTERGLDVRGTVQLVRPPGVLRDVLPAEGPRLTLGASQSAIFVRIETEAKDPVVRLPLGGDRSVAFFLYSFNLEYGFVENTVSFGMAADLTTTPPDLLTLSAAGNGVKVVTPLDVDFSLGASLTAPPVPVPEWSIDYQATRSPTSNATDQMGFQVFAGVGDDHPLARYYVRRSKFSLSYFPLCPGGSYEGGLILGGPSPRRYSNRESYFRALTDGTGDAAGTLYAHFQVTRGVALLVPPVLAALMNPLVFVPLAPPMPPFWLGTPYMTPLVDLYAEEVSGSLHVPGLVRLGFKFSRPIPEVSIQMILEAAALAASGFTATIPPNSPLRRLFFASLEFNWAFPLLGGATQRVTASVCLVDLLGGFLDLVRELQRAVETAGDLLGRLQRDPESLVRLVPPSARRFQFGGAFSLCGFSLSGSAALLTRKELHEELVLYHESWRPKRVGPSRMVPPPEPVAGPTVLVDLGRVNLRSQSARAWRELDRDLDRFGGREFAREAALAAALRAPLATEVLAAWSARLKGRTAAQLSQISADLKALGLDDAGAARVVQLVRLAATSSGSFSLTLGALLTNRRERGFLRMVVDELDRVRGASASPRLVALELVRKVALEPTASVSAPTLQRGALNIRVTTTQTTSVRQSLALAAGPLWNAGQGMLSAEGALLVKCDGETVFDADAKGRLVAANGVVTEVSFDFSAGVDLCLVLPGGNHRVLFATSMSVTNAKITREGFTASGSTRVTASVQERMNGRWSTMAGASASVLVSFRAAEDGVNVSAAITLPAVVAGVLDPIIDLAEWIARKDLLDWDGSTLTLDVGGLT